jgi:lysozyme
VIELLEWIVALVMQGEGCVLRAYPDPASPLYRALAARGLVRQVLAGKAEIPEDLRGLSGAPWTCGWGETLGVKQGDVWTQQQADFRLRQRVAQFLLAVYQRCPHLHAEPDNRVAACIDLAYNIGVGAFAASSVSRWTGQNKYQAAADAFLLWNKAGGRVLPGLTTRRQRERGVYLGQIPAKR